MSQPSLMLSCQFSPGLFHSDSSLEDKLRQEVLSRCPAKTRPALHPRSAPPPIWHPSPEPPPAPPSGLHSPGPYCLSAVTGSNNIQRFHAIGLFTGQSGGGRHALRWPAGHRAGSAPPQQHGKLTHKSEAPQAWQTGGRIISDVSVITKEKHLHSITSLVIYFSKNTILQERNPTFL